MNLNWEVVLIVLGIVVVVGVVYATVKMLIKRHPLYEQVKAVTSRLALKSATLHSKWQGWDISTRQGVFKVIPERGLEKSEKLRQEIDGKLERLLKPWIWRRVRSWVNQDRKRFLDNKAVRLKVVGPIDWPFWLFWRVVYGLDALVNWSAYSIVLSWPSHTMLRLSRRIENLQGLEGELDTAIKSVERLTKGATFLTKKRQQELKEQAEAKRLAAETAGKRRLFEEFKRRLVEGVNYNLRSQALTEESLVRSVLLPNLAAAKKLWRETLEEVESVTPDDSHLDESILLFGMNVLPIFEPVSVVEGTPPLSSIERHAQKMIESEGLILAAQEAFGETLSFSALEVKPEEPVSLGKARSLLVEAASHWSNLELDKMMHLARAADDLAKQAMRDSEDLKRWEDVILAFDRKRANIKESEAVLLVFGVELHQTADWEKAVVLLENEVPRLWAAFNWAKLNELNTQIANAFDARDQELNRRIDAERNKRKSKGQPLPEGTTRISQSATPTEEGPIPSNGPSNGSDQKKPGRLSFNYHPDPAHMEPLVSVRSRSTKVVLQCTRALAVSGDYIILNPDNPEEPLVWVRSKTTKKLLEVARSLSADADFEAVKPDDPELLALLRLQQGT